MLIILTSHKHASLLQNNSVLSKANKGSTTGGGSFKIRKSIYCTTPNLAKLFAHLLAVAELCYGPRGPRPPQIFLNFLGRKLTSLTISCLKYVSWKNIRRKLISSFP